MAEDKILDFYVGIMIEKAVRSLSVSALLSLINQYFIDGVLPFQIIFSV